MPPYDPFLVVQSDTNIAIQKITQIPITRKQIRRTRAQIDLSWCRNDSFTPFLNCSDGCLFDLERDPCETQNIIEERRDIARRLLDRIGEFWGELVPQGNSTIDPNANPQRYNNTWCTWLDDSWCVKTPNNINLEKR